MKSTIAIVPGAFMVLVVEDALCLCSRKNLAGIWRKSGVHWCTAGRVTLAGFSLSIPLVRT